MPYTCGDILFFYTDKTKNLAKAKYHLCVCTRSGLYLFINSNPFQGSFRITRTDFPALPKPESHVSCNAPVLYRASSLARYRVQLRGRLTDECLRRLMAHVEESDVMPQEDIETVVSAIFNHLSG